MYKNLWTISNRVRKIKKQLFNYLNKLLKIKKK